MLIIKSTHSMVKLCLAISRAPSYVEFPPMKPAACTNTQPGMPDRSLSAWSRKPRHADGMLRRLSKLPGPTDTAWMRHFFSLSSSYRQKRVAGCKTGTDTFSHVNLESYKIEIRSPDCKHSDCGVEKCRTQTITSHKNE